MDRLHLRLLFANILIALCTLVELGGILIVLLSLQIVPSQLVSVINSAVSYLPPPPSTVVLSSGEGVIIGLIYMFMALYMYNCLINQRLDIIDEIALEESNERATLKDTL